MRFALLSVGILVALVASCIEVEDEAAAMLSACDPNKFDIDQVLDSLDATGPCTFDDFRYHSGLPDTIGDLSDRYILLGVDSCYTEVDVRELFERSPQLDPDFRVIMYGAPGYAYKEAVARLREARSCVSIAGVLSQLSRHPMVVYAHYTMRTDNCPNDIGNPIGKACVYSYSSAFFVKVKDAERLEDLQALAVETKTEVIGPNQFMPVWVQMRATKLSNGDAAAMVKRFYESELFANSELDVTKYPVE